LPTASSSYIPAFAVRQASPEKKDFKALSFGEGLGEDSFSFVKKRTPRYGEGFSIKGFLFF